VKISADFITFFISCVFTLAGVLNYYTAEHIWPLLWIVAFISLLATVGIDVIERFHIEKRVEQMLNDEGQPPYLRRQAD